MDGQGGPPDAPGATVGISVCLERVRNMWQAESQRIYLPTQERVYVNIPTFLGDVHSGYRVLTMLCLDSLEMARLGAKYFRFPFLEALFV